MRAALVGVGLLLGACTSSSSSSGQMCEGGDGAATCNTDCDCGGDICNTNGAVCMHACSTTADCSATENAACAIIPKASGSGNATDHAVCQCGPSTCGGGSTCNPFDLICETICTEDSDCSGYSRARTCQSGSCLPFPDGG